MSAGAHRYREVYGGDPQDAPSYTIADAARYLRLPASTLRWWVLGKTYLTMGGIEVAQPVIALADPARRLLSFRNLVEAHVVSSLRREHNVLLPAVRAAIDYMKDRFGTSNPLSDRRLATDGVDV